MNELNLFLKNLISQTKNNPLFLSKIAELSLQGDIKHFVNFFDNLAEKDRKQIVRGAVLKKKIINAMSQMEEFDQLLLDKIKSYGFVFTIKDYTALKNKSNYKNGFKQLDDNIYSKTNERLKYLQEFMELYENANKNSVKLDEAIFKEYAEKIAFKNIEREAVTSTKVKCVKLTGKAYPKKISVPITRNVKTQSQKDFDFIFPTFAKFISKNVKEDFLQVLSLLNLDFPDFLKKVSKFDKDFAVLREIVEKIDLADYAKTLTAKEETKLHTALFQYFSADLYKSEFENLFNKKTQESASKIFSLVFKLNENKLSTIQIKSIFDIYTDKLQETYGSAKSGGEIVYSEVYKNYKPNTKKNKEKLEALYVTYEKEQLMNSVNINPAVNKVKLHKL